MNPDNFINRINNIMKLYNQNVYSFTEYSEEIDKLISELSVSKIEANSEEFLLKIAPLVNDDIINLENLVRIKKILKTNDIGSEIDFSINSKDLSISNSKDKTDFNYIESSALVESSNSNFINSVQCFTKEKKPNYLLIYIIIAILVTLIIFFVIKTLQIFIQVLQ